MELMQTTDQIEMMPISWCDYVHDAMTTCIPDDELIIGSIVSII